MIIQGFSKQTSKNVDITINSDELMLLQNIITAIPPSTEYDPKQHKVVGKLYADLILASDLVQYGHIDNFTLNSIVIARSNDLDSARIRKSTNLWLAQTLSNDEIEIFNSYLADNDIKTALGNSDFRQIYEKITNNSAGEFLETIIY